MSDCECRVGDEGLPTHAFITIDCVNPGINVLLGLNKHYGKTLYHTDFRLLAHDYNSLFGFVSMEMLVTFELIITKILTSPRQIFFVTASYFIQGPLMGHGLMV